MSGIGGLAMERNRANPRVPGRAGFNTGSNIGSWDTSKNSFWLE